MKRLLFYFLFSLLWTFSTYQVVLADEPPDDGLSDTVPINDSRNLILDESQFSEAALYEVNSAQLSEELRDQAFDRYLNIMVIPDAVKLMDPSMLVDAGLQLVEGERVLLRSHKAISADDVLKLAIRVAIEKRDRKTLERIKEAAGKINRIGIRKSAEAAISIVGVSRGTKDSLMLPIDQTSHATIIVLKTYLELIQQSSLTGEVEAIEGIINSLQNEDDDWKSEVGLTKEQVNYLINAAKSALASAKETEINSPLRNLMAESRDSFDSDRNSVRSRVAGGGWYVVWGVNINEAEYVKVAASIYSGTLGLYLKNYVKRTIDKIRATRSDLAERVLWDAVSRALRSRSIVRVRDIGIKGGIATYRRWKYISAHVPDGTEKYKIHGPFGSWTWGYRPKMKLVRKRIPLPNHHQPFVAFRVYRN